MASLSEKTKAMTAAEGRVIRRRRSVAQALIQELIGMQRRAHDAGLYVTARALNNAQNALGWELAGDVVLAGKAARGERAGEQ